MRWLRRRWKARVRRLASGAVVVGVEKRGEEPLEVQRLATDSSVERAYAVATARRWARQLNRYGRLLTKEIGGVDGR